MKRFAIALLSILLLVGCQSRKEPIDEPDEPDEPDDTSEVCGFCYGDGDCNSCGGLGH